VTQTEIAAYKVILERKRDELDRATRNREAIAVERTADDIDAVQSYGDREVAICHMDRDTKTLKSVTVALRRVQDGTFGTCLHCDEDIAAKRLNAVPWTYLCLSCQERADREKRDGRESLLDELLIDAA
jgi:DnaK suppressor protein